MPLMTSTYVLPKQDAKHVDLSLGGDKTVPMFVAASHCMTPACLSCAHTQFEHPLALATDQVPRWDRLDLWAVPSYGLYQHVASHSESHVRQVGDMIHQMHTQE